MSEDASDREDRPYLLAGLAVALMVCPMGTAITYELLQRNLGVGPVRGVLPHDIFNDWIGFAGKLSALLGASLAYWISRRDEELGCLAGFVGLVLGGLGFSLAIYLS